jgi:hypothetical protein
MVTSAVELRLEVSDEEPQAERDARGVLEGLVEDNLEWEPVRVGLEGVKGGLEEMEEEGHREMEELGVVNGVTDGKEEGVLKRERDTRPEVLGHRVGMEEGLLERDGEVLEEVDRVADWVDEGKGVRVVGMELSVERDEEGQRVTLALVLTVVLLERLKVNEVDRVGSVVVRDDLVMHWELRPVTEDERLNDPEVEGKRERVKDREVVTERVMVGVVVEDIDTEDVGVEAQEAKGKEDPGGQLEGQVQGIREPVPGQ